jgi:hypothetical protein
MKKLYFPPTIHVVVLKGAPLLHTYSVESIRDGGSQTYTVGDEE